MKEQQEKRYQKLFTEEFYLLDKNKLDNKLVFSICGSTKNVYTTTIYLGADKGDMFNAPKGDMFCTCPDKKSHAKRNACLCKHELFTLIRVLGVKNDDNMFTSDQMPVLTGNTLQLVLDNFERLNMNTNHLINKNLSEKFKNGTITPQEPDQLEALIKEKASENDAMCGICFDPFDNVENVKICTDCHNIMHTKCFEKWVEMGNKLCVYCRRPTKTNKVNKTNKPVKPSQYQNLS